MTSPDGHTIPIPVSPAEHVYKITGEEVPNHAVTPVADQSDGWTPDHAALYAAQDDCLVAIEDNRPLPTAALKQLPPWRAVMVARLAARCGVGLESGTVDQLTASARALGGAAVLDDWWVRYGV